MGVRFCLLTGKPCVTGTSILKRRILALNLVQTLMGSLGSQNTQPTLQEIRYVIPTKHDWTSVRVFFFVYFILMMSMPVTVRLTWSPAAAQSRGSSCRVIPATRPSKSHCRHKVAVFHTALSPCEETRLRRMAVWSPSLCTIMTFGQGHDSAASKVFYSCLF